MSDPTRLIDARLDAFIEKGVELDPLTATYVGIKGYDDKLPEPTPDWPQPV